MNEKPALVANQGQSPGEGQSPLGHRACDSTFSPPTSFFQNCRCLSSVMMTSLVESPHLSLCLPAMSGKKFLPLSGAPTDNPQHLPLEDPAYLERSFVCRFRCLLDNSSGFLELNFHGHLKFLPGQNNRSEDGILESPQLTLFAIATPHQPLTILELQIKTVLFQTKHKLDFTPVACDSRYDTGK